MAVKHNVFCTRCGTVYNWFDKHACPNRWPENDTPFATVVERNLPMMDEVTGKIVARFKAELVDMEDKAIVDAVIKAAQEEGITMLYLLDKQFIMEAIREKLIRQHGGAVDG